MRLHCPIYLYAVAESMGIYLVGCGGSGEGNRPNSFKIIPEIMGSKFSMFGDLASYEGLTGKKDRKTDTADKWRDFSIMLTYFGYDKEKVIKMASKKEPVFKARILAVAESGKKKLDRAYMFELGKTKNVARFWESLIFKVKDTQLMY